MKNTLSLLIILILLIFPFYLFAQSPLALNDNVKTDILKDFFGSLSDKERGKLLKDLRNEFGKEFEDISGVERFRPGERPLDQNKITKPDKEKQVLSQKEKSKSTDINDLKVFGHSLFNKNISTFSPVDDAVPRDNYKLGPGDEIVFYLSGSEEDTRSVTVNRDGNMMFPLIGPVNVAGMTFNELQKLTSTRYENEFVGVKSSITLGRLRAINIFVTGEVSNPGLYSVSAMTTVTNAILTSGGPNEIGSLRNIIVRRNGRTISKLDMYEILMKGDTSNDIVLDSGDIIFVPPYENYIEISGEVKRPGIYELLKHETLEDAIGFSGGLKGSAYSKVIKIIRTASQKGSSEIVNVNLEDKNFSNFLILQGDKINVPKISDKIINSVETKGALVRPGHFSWFEGMRISDLIQDGQADLFPFSDLEYSLLVRTINERQDINTYAIDLGQILLNKDSEYNINLKPQDKLIVFSYPDEKLDVNSDIVIDESDTDTFVKKDSEIEESNNFSRDALLTPIIKQLKRQATIGNPAKIVSISGSIKEEGQYPLSENFDLQSLIIGAGGLEESAFTETIELRRINYNEDGNIFITNENINFENIITGFDLKSRDHITVRKTPGWSPEMKVVISGEVLYPGEYLITKDDRLADIIIRAGGFTNNAFLKGAVFTRDKVREQQIARSKELGSLIKKYYATSILTSEEKDIDIDTLNDISRELETSNANGRLLIDLEKALTGEDAANITLQSDDKIHIPEIPDSVSVIGEVRRASSFTFSKDRSVNDYIALAAGITKRADKGSIYVVKADGSTYALDNENIFSFYSYKGNPEVGDTIVVPIDSAYKDDLPYWKDITQIVYQGALTAASINALPRF